MISARSQDGSAHVIIIVVLVLALMGALSWIFWQNFSKDKDTQPTSYKECVKATNSKIQESYPEVCVTKEGKRFTNPSQKVSSKDLDQKLITESSNDIFPKKIVFSYPEGWKFSSEMTKNKVYNYGSGDFVEGNQEVIKIISPSGGYTVRYSVHDPYSGDAVGGGETIAYVLYEVSSSLKDATFVAYVGKDLEGRYRGMASLVKESSSGEYPTWSQLKVGDPVGPTWGVFNATTSMAFTASVSIKSLEDRYGPNYKGETSLEIFKKAYSGKEFEQAKAILLTTKVE